MDTARANVRICASAKAADAVVLPTPPLPQHNNTLEREATCIKVSVVMTVALFVNEVDWPSLQ